MDKNFKIHDYCFYAHYQNNARSDRINLIHSKHYLNNYNSFGNLITNYKISVNKPSFKENNFFLKTNNNNNKNSRLINKTNKLTKLKTHYNNLILKTNQNKKNISTIPIKNNKSLINHTRSNILTNYYSNIFINNKQNNEQGNGKNINKIIVPRLNTNTSEKHFNNNSFVSICSCRNNNENKKSETNIFKINTQNKIIENNNKKIVNKFSSSPYLNAFLTENNEDINENNHYNEKKYYYNQNKYKRNNAINFNENINYNNIKNIENNRENSISKKIVNYNEENNNNNQHNQSFLNGNKTTKSTKTKIKINVYPNYQKIKKNVKLYQPNDNKKVISKINIPKNNQCLKCQNQKLNFDKNKNYNNKEPFIENYAFYEIKNIHSIKCYNNYRSKKYSELINKTEGNIHYNKKNKIEEKENLIQEMDDKKILSLAKKNFELFLKKNNKLNLKHISSNNIKKRKRHKSQNQIDKEKNLDKKKALSYRESMSIKPYKSSGKNKVNVLKNVTKTLSQKKYKEDYKSLINKEEMNNVKSVLFENHKENYNDIKSVKNVKKNINKYDISNLKRQIGCQFSIFKKREKSKNDCLNGIITYFNSENLRNRKIFN